MYAEMTPSTDRTDAAALASEFHGYMHAVARRMLWNDSPVSRLMDAEDFGQEIATTVWRRRDRWNPSVCKFTTFVWQSARHTLNNCYDYARASMRSASTWRARSLDDAGEVADRSPPAGRADSAAFWGLIAEHITGRQLQVLEQHYRHGRSLREIASELGIRQKTAYKLAVAAIDKLLPFGRRLSDLARAN